MGIAWVDQSVLLRHEVFTSQSQEFWSHLSMLYPMVDMKQRAWIIHGLKLD